MRPPFILQATTGCWLFATALACSRTALDSPVPSNQGTNVSATEVRADASPIADLASDLAGTEPVRPVTLLAEGQLNPAAIAVDQHLVYWFNLGASQRISGTKDSTPYMGGQVASCAKTGCDQAPAILASDRWQGIGTQIPVGFATDGEAVYWSDMTSLTADAGADESVHLFKCAVTGCGGSPEIIAEDGDERLALHGGYLVWTRFEAVVNVCPTTGCGASPLSLWSAGYWPCATGIAIDDGGVFWTTTNADVFRCPLAGCNNTPAVLMQAGARDAVATFDLAIDGSYIYLADRNAIGFGMILQCAKSGCGDQPIVLANGLNAPSAVATDGAHVYWLEQNQVRRCAVTGCNNLPTTLATGTGNLAALALDERFAYVADSGSSWSDGRIWMVAK